MTNSKSPSPMSVAEAVKRLDVATSGPGSASSRMFRAYPRGDGMHVGTHDYLGLFAADVCMLLVAYEESQALLAAERRHDDASE